MIYQLIERLSSISWSVVSNNWTDTAIVGAVLLAIIVSASLRFLAFTLVALMDILIALPWVACNTKFAYVASTYHSCGAQYSDYIHMNYRFDLWYIWVGYLIFIAIWIHSYSHGIRKGV